MAVKKPGGHVRIVGNLSYPPGSSFNDGISDDCMKIWPVTMTTAPMFADMILDAGQNAIMA